MSTMKFLAIGLMLGSLLAAPTVQAQVDMNGPWGVLTGAPLNSFGVATFVQSGSNLSMGGGSYTGTINLATRAFALVGPPNPPCQPYQYSGIVAADGRTFSGSLVIYIVAESQCSSLPLPLTGSRCGNGVIDPGEQCDDQNFNSGDCCSATCQLEASGSPCTGSNVCLIATCDGAGTCVQGALPNNGHACSDNVFCNGSDTCSGGACVVHAGDPCVGQPVCSAVCNESLGRCSSPTNTPCDDGLFCNGADSCNAGVCIQHTGDPCAGRPACEACNEQINQCLAPAGTHCESDGRSCTADFCNGGGTCQHPVELSDWICRMETGPCDRREYCDGTSGDCPADAFAPSDTPCGTCARCDATGACLVGPRAAASCKRPVSAGGAQLKLASTSASAPDRLQWKWTHGDATSAAELGNPTLSGGNQVTLCVFDDSAASPALLFATGAPTGPGWTTTGLGYHFRGSAPVKAITLAAGAAGRAKMSLKGADNLVPFTPLALPLLTQLQNPAGSCWEARFTTATKNTGKAFKATSD